MYRGLLSLVFAVGFALLPMAAGAAPAGVNLGTAQSFAVLAGSTVTNTGPTVVNGDLGVSPGNSVTGFPPGTVNGTIHAGDAVAAQAQSDLTAAYNDAAGRACDVNLTGQDLGGKTLTSAVYCFDSSAQLTGTLTLNAQGNPDAVFIFQIGSTLTTASGSTVSLINGASPCNIFWKVGSSATLGTTTRFQGSILALTSITMNTNATVEGRVLARNGAVTLDNNTITNSCTAAQPSPSASPTATGGASPSPTATGGASPSPTGTGPGPSPTGTGPGPSPTGTSAPSPTATGPGPQPSPTSTGPAPTPTGPGPSPTPTGGGVPSPSPLPPATPLPTSIDRDGGIRGSQIPSTSGLPGTGLPWTGAVSLAAVSLIFTGLFLQLQSPSTGRHSMAGGLLFRGRARTRGRHSFSSHR